MRECAAPQPGPEQRDGETERQAKRQRDRETKSDSETERQTEPDQPTDRQADTQTDAWTDSQRHRRTARQTETDGPMDRQKTGRAHPPARTHARTHAHARTRARARTHARATACVLMDEGTSGPIMLSSFYHDSCAMPAGLLGDPVIDGHMGGVHGVSIAEGAAAEVGRHSRNRIRKGYTRRRGQR